MASLKYHKDVKRWRVFWHVTLPDGSVDKGSKSFKTKPEGEKFKEHCERQGEKLKRARVVQVPLLEDAVADWQMFITQHTDRTQGLYNSVLRDFLAYLSDEVVLVSDLTTQHVSGYLNYLMGRRLKNKSVNNHLSAIKSFCSYVEVNYRTENPAKNIKKFKESPAEIYFIKRNEYNLILEHCDDIAHGWIRFIANTGLRATEFCNLKWQDYDTDARTITIIGKGRKRRTIGLNNIVVEILEERAGKKVKLKSHIFVRKDGLPLIRHTLHNYISKACSNAGVTMFGPHTLRHFFATQLLLAGVPIIKVSVLMGHSSITTTQKHYAHILSSDLAEVTSVLEAL